MGDGLERPSRDSARVGLPSLPPPYEPWRSIRAPIPIDPRPNPYPLTPIPYPLYLVAGTQSHRVAYEITDAILQPVRKPVGCAGSVLRPLRRGPARGCWRLAAPRTASARRECRSACLNGRSYRVHPLLHSGRRLDYVDHRAGERALPPPSPRAFPRFSVAVSVCRVAHRAAGAGAYAAEFRLTPGSWRSSGAPSRRRRIHDGESRAPGALLSSRNRG